MFYGPRKVLPADIGFDSRSRNKRRAWTKTDIDGKYKESSASSEKWRGAFQIEQLGWGTIPFMKKLDKVKFARWEFLFVIPISGCSKHHILSEGKQGWSSACLCESHASRSAVVNGKASSQLPAVQNLAVNLFLCSSLWSLQDWMHLQTAATWHWTSGCRFIFYPSIEGHPL